MGAFDFVVKPFEPEELMAVVNRATEQWMLAREADALRSEREAHLLELSAEKSRLRTILQAMGEGLLVVNVNEEVVLDNPATRRLLRIGPSTIRAPISEVLPDPRFIEEVHALLHGSPDAGAVYLEVRMAPSAPPVSSTASSALDAPVAIASPPPPDRYLRATLAPIRSAEGATLGVIIVLADITDEKALERSKTLFVSMVAHEIKAPIAAIEGYLRLIRDGSYDREPEQVPHVLDRCLERADALLLMVQDLLEINRRDGGRQQRRLELFNIAALVGELVRFHAPSAADRDIRIDVNIDPAAPSPVVDRNDVERIVTNLLSNAIKYNKDGGRVDVRVAAHPVGVLVEVRDTGVGMSPADIVRLGEEFFRAKDPRTRSVTGTGLGIALVKKIVGSYLGRLEVESVPEQGTTVRVVLPVPEHHT